MRAEGQGQAREASLVAQGWVEFYFNHQLQIANQDSLARPGPRLPART